MAIYTIIPSPENTLTSENIYLSLSAMQGKTLNEKCLDLYSKLDSKISAEDFNTLSNIVSSHTTQIGNKVEQVDFDDLSASVISAREILATKASNATVSQIQTDLTNLTNTVNNKAETTTVTNLRTYVDNYKAPLADFNTLKTNVEGKAEQTEVDAISTNLDTLTTKVNGLDTVTSITKRTNGSNLYHYITFNDGTIILEGSSEVSINTNSTVLRGELYFPITFTTLSSLSAIVSITYFDADLETGTNTPSSTITTTYHPIMSINNCNTSGFGYAIYNSDGSVFNDSYNAIIHYHVIGI